MKVLPTTLLRCLAGALLAAAALIPAQAADAPSGMWDYRITRGDTLTEISAELLENPDDWQRLQKLNRIADPRRLRPGSTIRIPFELLKKSATVATVIFVRGRATLVADPERSERLLALGEGVRSGDLIRTGDNASLSLRFADGSRVMIGPDSQISVVRLLEVGRATRPDALLKLNRGDAEIHMVPNAGRRFELQTPAMNLGVRGTIFRARVDPTGQAAGVEVLGGRVGAAAGRKQVQIDAGFGLLAVAGRPIAPPRPLLAAPVLAGQAPRSAEERLPLRFAWPPVPGAVAYRVQVLAGAADEQLFLDARFAQAFAQWPDLPDGQYRLRVRGIDAGGLEGVDAALLFVVHARPAAPLARMPISDSTSVGPLGRSKAPMQQGIPPRLQLDEPRVGRDRVRLSWEPPVPGQHVRLQIAEDHEFGKITLDRAIPEGSEFLAELGPGRYYARGRLITPDGLAGEDSLVHRFVVPLPPLLPGWAHPLGRLSQP